jgi:hypothetical protein
MFNPTDKDESDKLVTYSENDKHPENKGGNVNSSTGKSCEKWKRENIKQ